MASKIPPSAFSDYLAMGMGRSYEALAKRYGCSKKCVTQRAVKERWQERARELEREAAKEGERRATAAAEDATERHAKLAKLLLSRGLDALRNSQSLSTLEAVRTIQAAVKLERELGLTTGSDSSGGILSTRPHDGTLAPRAYVRFAMQSPYWLTTLLASVEHWGAKADAADRSIADQIVEFCAWIDETALREDLQPIIPIHQQLRLCFELEPDPSRAEEMEVKLRRLYGEMCCYREKRRVAALDVSDATTLGIEAPKSRWSGPGVRPKLTWRQAFGCDADDPIAFVAKNLGTPVLAASAPDGEVGSEDET